jgi:hypothetical protein
MGMDRSRKCDVYTLAGIACAKCAQKIVFVYFPPEVLNRTRPPRATEYPGEGSCQKRAGDTEKGTYRILGVV